MRILHCVHAYPPHTGGSEEVVARVSEALAARGHDVEVATRAHGERVDEGPVRVHGFDAGAPGWLDYRRFVRTGTWDVVMTYHSKVWTHLALFPFTDIPAPWVYAPVEFTDVDSRHPRHVAYYSTVEPWSLRSANAVMVLTRRDAERALRIAPGTEPHTSVVPNGVDFDAWAEPPKDVGKVRERYGVPGDAPLAVYAGGYWPHKDVATLVEAAADAERAHLVCAGPDRGTLDACHRIVRDRGVEGRVHLLETVPRDDLRELMHAADLFVSASTNEGFGLVFLQALSAGTPVAARDVGAVADLRAAGADIDVVESRGGFAAVMDDPPAPRRAGTSDVARRYDWSLVVDRIEALYEEVAG